jgi:hypothetical protein
VFVYFNIYNIWGANVHEIPFQRVINSFTDSKTDRDDIVKDKLALPPAALPPKLQACLSCDIELGDALLPSVGGFTNLEALSQPDINTPCQLSSAQRLIQITKPLHY